MASLRYALFYSLVLLSLQNLLSTADTITHNADGCELVTEDQVQFETAVTYNGNRYSVLITLDEYRGYRCRQSTSTAPGEANRCKSAHIEEQTFQAYQPEGSPPEVVVTKMCRPSTTVDVTKTVTLTLGGASVEKTVEWSNITDCECAFAS